ncbi:hypothetical protein C8R44DRAFT_986674 [Mycena epipterygia]|nr:hypothetical protein C8R44DRAFT_986674 [Mycena epipterygia]
MPLFGSSNTDGNKLEKHHPAATQLESTGYGAGTGPGRTHQMNATNDPMAAGTGTVGMGEPGMGNPGMNSATVGGRHHVPAGPHAGMGAQAGMHNDPMMANQQYGAGGAGVGGPAIPPTGNVSNHQTSGGGGGGAMTGKIEHAVGSLVGSKTLKAKGIQKEQEARGLKVQSQELAEAERLEQEAGMRRERAVAHGAHPDNRHVGGIPPAGGPGGVAGAGTGGPGPYN